MSFTESIRSSAGDVSEKLPPHARTGLLKLSCLSSYRRTPHSCTAAATARSPPLPRQATLAAAPTPRARAQPPRSTPRRPAVTADAVALHSGSAVARLHVDQGCPCSQANSDELTNREGPVRTFLASHAVAAATPVNGRPSAGSSPGRARSARETAVKSDPYGRRPLPGITPAAKFEFVCKAAEGAGERMHLLVAHREVDWSHGTPGSGR